MGGCCGRCWLHPRSKVSTDFAQDALHLSRCGEAISIGGGARLDKKLRNLRAQVRANRSWVGHRLADRREIRPEDIAAEIYITPTRAAPALKKVIDGYAAKSGITASPASSGIRIPAALKNGAG